MRVKTPVIPDWMYSSPYTASAELTPFPITISLETWSRMFWGVAKWRFQGELIYRTTDGVSWSVWQTHVVDIVLDTLTPGRFVNQEHLKISEGRNSSAVYFFGINGSSSTSESVSLQWRDNITGGLVIRDILWSGNHGDASGNVAPALQISGLFAQVLLGTNQSVAFNTAHNESGLLNADVSGITVLGSTIRLYVNSQTDVTVAGNTEVQSLIATMNPHEYLEYRDSDGNNPVWDLTTGVQLIDPLTT